MNELRYVYDEDAREAKDIADRLPRFGIEVKRLLKVDPGRARPRHFELWLSRDTFGGAAR